MVLRDEDLKRLDAYIIERFRRLNLQFFGPGVVNGLEVRCDPCGPGVVVGCGQAISPCGDDIVVCDDAYVDICKLIEKCRQKERDDCLPHQRPRDCPDMEEQWVLAIEFAERPERGVLPLRREPAKTCDCGGKGCGDASCSCKDDPTGWSGSAKVADKARGAPPYCEPSLLCDDYLFRVCPPPELSPACQTARGDNDDFDEDQGELLERIRCCVDALLENLPEAPEFDPQELDSSLLQNSDAWYRWLCLIKRHLLNFVARYPAANCQAVVDLQQLACLRLQDFQTPEAYIAYISETFQRLAIILVEFLFSCLCSGLLPPCPEPATGTSIPIATVKVNYANGGCRVVSVCNWTRLRRYSANLRTLNYWLSFLPFGRDLRRLLECLCCDLLSDLFGDDEGSSDPIGTAPDTLGIVNEPSPDLNDGGREVGGNGDGAGPSDLRAGAAEVGVAARLRERLNRRLRPQAVGSSFDRLAAVARSVSRDAGPVEPLALLGDLLGRQGKAPGPFGDAGRAAPAEALILNSLAAPILRGVATSPGLTNFAFDIGSGKGSIGAIPAKGPAGPTSEIDTMRAEIAALQSRLEALEGAKAPAAKDSKGKDRNG